MALNESKGDVDVEMISVGAKELIYVVYSKKLIQVMCNMIIFSEMRVVDASYSTVHVDATFNLVKAYVTAVSFKLIIASKGKKIK